MKLGVLCSLLQGYFDLSFFPHLSLDKKILVGVYV